MLAIALFIVIIAAVVGLGAAAIVMAARDARGPVDAVWDYDTRNPRL